MNPLRYMAELWKRGMLGAEGLTEDLKATISKWRRPTNAKKMERQHDREVARYHAAQARDGVIEPKRKCVNYGRPRRESWADTRIRELTEKKERARV